MKKLFTLFFITLLGISQIWALNAKIAGADWKGNRSWSGEHVTFTMDAPGATYDGTFKELDIVGNNVNTITWTVDQGYILKITGMNFRIGNSSIKKSTFYINDAYVAEQGITTGKNFSYDQLNLGNTDQIEFKSTRAVDLYYIDITYTITPITYYMVFHGNGGEGTMANQAISYDQTVALTANAFTQNYTFTYDANGGECGETSASVQFGFEGWATSANGEVVYTDGQQVTNLTHENNRVFDLYAVWTPKTITLPEATNGTMLFNGWFDENDQYVGKAGDVITPTKSLNLTAKWATALTPMFVLDKTEISIDQTAKLTMDNVTTPTVSIAPEGIVSYNKETGVITGLAAGAVTITISQEADGLISAKEEELVLTVTKKTPSLSFLLNDIDQLSVIIVQGETATVTFEKESDAEVVVSTISGGKYASYKDGVLTAGEIGVATFRATLPETETYFGTYKEFQVDVRKNPVHLPLIMSGIVWNSKTMKVASEGENSWDGSKGITLGDGTGGGFNYNDKYIILHFEGIPDKMTFELATTESPAGGATKVEWYIKESATQTMPETKIWTSTHTGTEFSDLQTVELQPTTRYVMLCYSGNFGGYFRNLQISELKYVQDPEPASIDFGSEVIYAGEVSKTVNVNWCNVAPLSVVSSNPRFMVSPSMFANYDQLGSQEITISYNHTNEVGDNSGVITISNDDAAYTKTIPVHAKTTRRIQTVQWNNELEVTSFAMNEEEFLPNEQISVIATIPSGGTIRYTSSDEEIIKVVDDTILVAVKEGKATITAYNAGDEEYEEVSDSQEFTVTSQHKQTIEWTQNLRGLLLGGQSVVLDASATSNMPITYKSNDESVVRVEGNELIIVGVGNTYVTATQSGGEDENGVDWLAVSAKNYVIVRDPASRCQEMSLYISTLTLNGDNLSVEETLNGMPTTLTFSAKHGKKSNGAWAQKPSYAALMIDQYTKVDGVWGWKNVFNEVVGIDEDNYGPYSIDSIATKLRFRTTENETYHTISSISIARAEMLSADVASIDEEVETNAMWTKTITVSHSNIDLMSLSTQNGLLTLSASTLGEGCGDYGDDAFTVSFTPTERDQDYNDVIVISDGKAQPSTITIPVHLHSIGLRQYLSKFDLPTSCLTTETVEIPQVTSTSGLEVVFISSDSTVAYVENNALKILSAGQVEISAYQAGDDRYGAVSSSRTITINLTPIEITEAPTANSIELGQTLSESELIGGNATVEGSFVWTAPETVPAFGTGSYSVTFIPTQSTIYGTATTMVELNVLPPTTYGVFEASFCAGGSAEFNGKTYTESAKEDVKLEIKNIYGGDSIIHVSIIANPTYLFPEEETVRQDEAFEWQGQVRATDVIGDYNFKAEYSTEAGCDSIYTLVLHVVSGEPTYGEYTAQMCEDGSVEFAGNTYYGATQDDILLEIKNQYGGDSIVHLTVIENPKYNMPLEKQTVYVNEVFEWQGEIRKTDEIGTFNIKAEYKTEAECDSIYSLELTVIERPTTYGEYTAQFCEGGSVEFAGTTYEAPVANEDVLLEIKNQYGGDSIVHLTVIENKKYNMPLEKQTVYVNEVFEWQGEVRKTDEIGTFNFKAEYKTEAECDSIYSLELTVIERPTTYGEYTAQFCEGGSVEFAGQVYESAVENEDILLDEKNQFGGDSIVHLTVIELKKSASAEEMKMYVGEDKSWNGIALKDSTAGVYTIVYETTNAAGCDSTVTLTLTIEKQAAYEVAYTIYTCAGEPVEYRGKSYSEAGPYEVTVEDAVRDTTIALTVVVYATDHQDLYETVKVGDAIELGEQSWRTADGWNISGTYDVEEEDLGEIEFTLTLKNENGCDSVIVRHVTVEEAEKPETPTALDNVEADITAVKVLRDGVIYIRRGDSLYTIEGRKAE